MNLVAEQEFNIKSFKETFIDYLDVDADTLVTYKKGIESFSNYLENNNISTPTRDDVISYRDYLKENYLDNTVNTYMVAIRSLFKYLDMHKVYPNITENVKGAKTPCVPKKQVLTQEQATNIYQQLTDKREKALFGLLVTTGLRGVEVANAKIEDIKIYNNEKVLWVQCKGHTSKDEYVKLSDKVIQDIADYIEGRTSGYIFVGNCNRNRGEKLTTKSIRLYIKNIFKRFDLDYDTFSLHSLRRTAGTIAYLLGEDVYKIQQLLHHKNINTTIRYINSTARNENKAEYKLSDAILG